MIPHVSRRFVGPVNVLVQERHRASRRVMKHGLAEADHGITGFIVSIIVEHRFVQESLVSQVCERGVVGFETFQSALPGAPWQFADLLPQFDELLVLDCQGEP